MDDLYIKLDFLLIAILLLIIFGIYFYFYHINIYQSKNKYYHITMLIINLKNKYH